MRVPLSVYLLFLAPTAALAFAFFLFRPWWPRGTHWPILASCAVVSAASIDLAAKAYTGWGMDAPLGVWMAIGNWDVYFGVRIDGVGSAVLAMVAVVGALIHVYAVGYMREDPGFSRFFLCFHLFYLAMIGMLVSNNFVQFYLFWEGVGLCSYLLIGFWTHKPAARGAALQAFVVNRVGDLAFLIAILILLKSYGDTRFKHVFEQMAYQGAPLLGLVGLLLFVAAASKSAQFPLYFWLPDAMEGPTPVSALMHAATMVTAGIFLLARSWPLISFIPDLPWLIAAVGAVTAVFAGALACFQTDLKRILAYSTVSHLGLMALALGLGRVGAAVLHLIMHGFFKAVLFLCAGNIAHGLGKSAADISEVGGLRRSMPFTLACFAAAAVSLAGVWPFAGFFSKDGIIEAAFDGGPVWTAFALAAASLGAFYISRMLFLVFFGPCAEQGAGPERKPGHPHEAPAQMGMPVAFLAMLALFAGLLAPGIGRLLASGALPEAESLVLAHFSWTVFAAGTAAAGLGFAAAYYLTMVRPGWDWEWRRGHPGLESLVRSDLGWRKVVSAVAALGWRLAEWVGGALDHRTLDGLIESSAPATVSVGGALSLKGGRLNDYLWWILAGTAALLGVALC
ncbi:MAG: NADH-quinone oxidoreductase subunit L [Elusimicrobia bacterium]|nr:NADH-quinone oxidoreductase subunit L [Elusimicrobiota bacterium]